MIDQPVIVYSTSAGPFVGVLRLRVGAEVELNPARQVRWADNEHLLLDAAAEGPPRKAHNVSAICPGPVVLTDVTMVAPLSDAACKAIVRGSEDKLPLKC